MAPTRQKLRQAYEAGEPVCLTLYNGAATLADVEVHVDDKERDKVEEYLIRCVNSYAALVEACQAAREWLGSTQTGPGLRAAQDQLDSAIAQAKGE